MVARHRCLHKRRTCISDIHLFLFFRFGAFALPAAQAAGLSKSETRFVYVDANGKVQSTEVISHYTGKMRIYPFPHLDPKLARAATIAEERAHAHSRSRCWRYVKEALLAAGAVDSIRKPRWRGRRVMSWCTVMDLSVFRCVTRIWLRLARSGLWLGPCRGPRGNSYCPWICERFSGIDAFAPALIGVYAKISSGAGLPFEGSAKMARERRPGTNSPSRAR